MHRKRALVASIVTAAALAGMGSAVAAPAANATDEALKCVSSSDDFAKFKECASKEMKKKEEEKKPAPDAATPPAPGEE
ncbi:hypothetical protein ACFYV7_39475 [Nocardia suismassiliense]|uniref:PsiF repeat-containing protein n=1 Tax=Nocardia suismassiliense TaxID=2077092 RepID=A0ABW6R5X7_9NOCA